MAWVHLHIVHKLCTSCFQHDMFVNIELADPFDILGFRGVNCKPESL